MSTQSYQHETLQLRKNLKDIRLELDVFRRQFKKQLKCDHHLTDLNETSIWNPATDRSVELSDVNYSRSSTAPRLECTNNLSRLSDIPNCSNSSARQRNSNTNLQEPLHSSLQYPQFSTPRQSQTGSVQELDEYINDCVRQLVFDEGHDITVLSDDSSLLDSGYTSLPRIYDDLKDSLSSSTSSTSDSADKNSKCAINSTVDSDSTAFFEIPMTKRPVTHKSERLRSITKHLKYIGKKIQRHREDHVLNTLAVL